MSIDELDLLDEDLNLSEDLYDPLTASEPSVPKTKVKVEKVKAKKPANKPAKATKPAATEVEQPKLNMPKATGKAAQAKAKLKTKPTVKSGKSSGEKVSRAGWKKMGLRLPQVRILQFLAKCKKDVNRKEISTGANCDYAWLNGWIGSHNEATRKRSDEKLMSLITLKAIDFHELPDPKTGKDTIYYRINAKGLKLLKELQ